MLKKIAFVALTLTLAISVATAADVCPSVNDIKVGQFHGWQPLNANSDDPASSHDIDIFKKKIKSFYQAEWSEDYAGNAHCYYSDYLEVLLAKDTPQPKVSDHWKDLGFVLRCQSSAVKDCEF